MRTCQTFAFLLFGAAAIVSTLSKSWPITLLAAGACFTLAPVVFELSS